jgi:dCMP deaminase
MCLRRDATRRGLSLSFANFPCRPTVIQAKLSGMTTPTDTRPDWDTYFMDIARVVSSRGNCSRRKVGAVAVADHRIISTGYNGTPRGIRNCCEGGCARCASNVPSGSALSECVCSHAEENAITQAAYHGVRTKDAILYVTISPCLTCAKMIINAGIREVIYGGDYAFNEQTRALFSEAGVACRAYTPTGS